MCIIVTTSAFAAHGLAALFATFKNQVRLLFLTVKILVIKLLRTPIILVFNM